MNRIKKQRVHRLPQLTAVEEVNFSLLAIKFSKTLTKDMVFTGIRDILKKIGDFIFRGYELEIDFFFGTLMAKENRVKFVFNQARLLEVSGVHCPLSTDSRVSLRSSSQHCYCYCYRRYDRFCPSAWTPAC